MNRQRFSVDATGCWLWSLSLSPDGYARVPYQGHRIAAHRWMWLRLRGPIPDGMELDHLCGVRHCVNPAHLEVVTPIENRRRTNNPYSLNRRKTHCVNGHPFDEVNTRHSTRDGWPCRDCRACDRIRQARYYRARRAALGLEVRPQQ